MKGVSWDQTVPVPRDGLGRGRRGQGGPGGSGRRPLQGSPGWRRAPGKLGR